MSLISKEIIPFEISSPDELREALGAHKVDGRRFAQVRVLGPGVITRQFNFPKSTPQELMAGLKLEASEAFSQENDLELSYQITGTDEHGTYGIYSVMPGKLLLEYLDCFKTHPLIPVSLTAFAVGAVMDFLKDRPFPGDNFCLVNFLKPHAVNIIIFTDAKPTLFRELYDLSDSDYKEKITDTIRYSCSHSASKRIDHIFFIGDLNGKDFLIKNLKELESPFLGQPTSVENAEPVDLSGLNLFGKFVCGLQERARLVFIFSLLSVISVVLAVFLAWQYEIGNSKLQKLKSMVNLSEYSRAIDLQAKVRCLK